MIHSVTAVKQRKLFLAESPVKANERQTEFSQTQGEKGKSKGLKVGKFSMYLGDHDYSRLVGTLFLGK